MCLISEKLLKHDEKIRKKTMERVFINEKPLKLNKKTKKKINYLCFVRCFI